jgi:hypothetical protein
LLYLYLNVVSPQDILTAGYHFLSAEPVILYEPANASWLLE